MPSRVTLMKSASAIEILYHDELEQYSGRELLQELKQTLIGPGCACPDSGRQRALYQPGQRRQHAHLHADLECGPPDLASIQQIQQAIVHEVKSICADVSARDRPMM